MHFESNSISVDQYTDISLSVSIDPGVARGKVGEIIGINSVISFDRNWMREGRPQIRQLFLLNGLIPTSSIEMHGIVSMFKDNFPKFSHININPKLTIQNIQLRSTP